MVEIKNILNHQSYSSLTDPLGSFVVRVDGEVDTSYVEALERARRHEAVKYAGWQAIRGAGRLCARVGVGIINAMDDFVQAGLNH